MSLVRTEDFDFIGLTNLSTVLTVQVHCLTMADVLRWHLLLR
jgi:hypothetical protein